jgi:hypothetical protein
MVTNPELAQMLGVQELGYVLPVWSTNAIKLTLLCSVYLMVAPIDPTNLSMLYDDDRSFTEDP